MEFDTFEVNSNNYPVLLSNEKIISRQNNVTLITNKRKYQKGLIYLTTLRLLWFKSGTPQNIAIAIKLEDVLSKETSSNLLSASTIKLGILKKAPTTQDRSVTLEQSQKKIEDEKDWECQVCSQTNKGSVRECILCGVPREVMEDSESSDSSEEEIDIGRLRRDIESRRTSSFYPNNNNYSTFNNPTQFTTTPTSVKVTCSACGYVNDGPVEYCKVCMTKINNSSAQVPPPEQKITCLICMYPNEPTQTMCTICGTILPTSQPTYQSRRNGYYGYSNFTSATSPTNNKAWPENPYENLMNGLPPTHVNTDTKTTMNEKMTSPSNVNTNKELPQSPTSLQSPHSSTTSVTSNSSTKNNNITPTNKVKLLFKSGQSQFYHELCVTLREELWKIQKEEIKENENTRIGVAGIIQKMKDNQKVTNDTMTEAFHDLNNLMMKASEMVKIAESISQKIIKDKAMENSSEQNQLKELLLDLGISNPVTKKSIGTGSRYYQELAKQLANFTIKLMDKHGNVMTLPDIYCLYNRARGVELVSPEDLYKACNLFSKLQIPLNLRRFKSGLLIIESAGKSDDETIKQICNYIKDNSNNNTKGINSIEISKELKIPVILANEYLELAEYSNQICRDETLEGIYYYINLFEVFDVEV